MRHYNLRINDETGALLEQQAAENGLTPYSYISNIVTSHIVNPNGENDRLKNLETLVIELTKFCRFNANMLIKIIEKNRPDDFKNIIKTEKERAWPGEVPNERHN